MNGPDTLYLIDASAIAYRAHFAFVRRPLLNSRGEDIGAVFGFCSTVLSILNRRKPAHLAVVFDPPKPVFRHTLYPAYKETREKMPDELVRQMPLIKELSRTLRLNVYEVPGYEADDVIATLACRARDAGMDALIVSGDKDMMQLVGERVRMLAVRPEAGGEEITDGAGVRGKFGVDPGQIVDFLALMGDASDNVPGVEGVGEKTAARLLEQFGSLDGLYEGLDRVDRPALRKKLEAGRENALLSRRLVTLVTDVPGLPSGMDALRLLPWDPDAVRELFTRLEFKKFLKDLDAASRTREVESAKRYRLVESPGELREVLQTLREAGFCVVDTETTGLDVLRAQLVGVSFSCREGQAWFVPLCTRAPGSGDDLFEIPRVEHPEYLPELRALLEDPAVRKSGQNVKYDLGVLRTAGIRMRGVVFDTMIASQLLDGDRTAHNLDALALTHFNYTKIPTSALIGTGREAITMDRVPVDELSEYACEDADMTWRLTVLLGARMRTDGCRRLFEEVEVPLIAVLEDMERHGIGLDTGVLAQLGGSVREKLALLQRKIFDACGFEFNLLSPQQVGQALFEQLSIQNQFPGMKPRKTATGYSTDIEVLTRYASHPLVSDLIEHRQMSKLLSTYIDALPRLVNPGTGRLHTSFHQAGTATGRLSSNEPNLQNIPIRTELGRQIRRAFVPSGPGRVLLTADYSQIELRVLAHVSGDPALVEAHRAGRDVHQMTAARIFGVPEAQVTPVQRARAKTINFGIIYGMGPKKLSTDLGIPLEAAREFIDSYFRIYPGVRAFIDRTLSQAASDGYVTTLLGRRRPLGRPGAEKLQGNLENVAVNTPIQGTAAEIIKVAMLRIHDQLVRGKLDAAMILQVHDELVFDCASGDADALGELARREMENACQLTVPLKVNLGRGANWLDAHA